MPELPEVETLRLSLQSAILGRTVCCVDVRTRSVVAMPGDPPAGIVRSRRDRRPVRLQPRLLLQDCAIQRFERRGKQLAIISADGPALNVQLGMTGGLSLTSQPRRHTHVVWTLDDGTRLTFSDPRRFGLLGAHPDFEDLQHTRWRSLGPDALSLRAPDLIRACRGARRAIKTLLLDQKTLAGIGNIYADEALFDAGIHPLAPANSLSRPHLARLTSSIRRVLRQAIRSGGSSIRDFRSPLDTPGGYQSHHRVYGRSGLPCPRCGHTLVRTFIAQRGTVFCPHCQPAALRGEPHVFHTTVDGRTMG
ncbi:MAG: bifunctional DNA-formamidopyrimidine glycosylase/DNA-(apurinic or apyrimidinic site) lyase [Phycisphaerales bacterium]|nr:bifunctional DNA-formamidopyrimidine glycosylase/DNA-(apurinic or apyrimidinic site) lyase [Phycisphaerales bacterium]